MLNTLKGKLMTLTVSLILLLNIALLFFVDNLLYNSIKEKVKEEMETTKKVIINSMKNSKGLSVYDKKEEIWKSIYESNNGLRGYVGLYDENENLIESKGEIARDSRIGDILKESDKRKSIIYFDRDSGLVATYIYPIYMDGNLNTIIVIQNPYFKEIISYKSTISEFAIMQTVLSIVIILALNSSINKIVTPLKQLSSKIKLFGNGENVENIVIYSNDEIGEVTKSFNKMKDERERLQNVSRDFFNNATHELKTPITSIYSYLQILAESNFDDLDKEFRTRAIDRMSMECIKLKDLVQKLLDVSRGSVNRERKYETIKINDLIYEIIDGLTIRCHRLDKKIITELDTVITNGVRQEIEEIILNLLDNAIKYSSGNIIKVILKSDSKVLKIENEIENIPDSIKDKLLEPFIKYNSSRKVNENEITSSGLGLYLCTQHAEANGINLSYEIIGNNIIFECIFR